jgi:hypothetical protein
MSESKLLGAGRVAHLFVIFAGPAAIALVVWWKFKAP